MTTLTPSPKMQFFDANGNPLVGGKLYTYSAGTTSPLATYTDSTGGSANTNPIILDSRGEANVWLGVGSYKMVLKDSVDSLIWTVDNILGAPSSNAALVALAASDGSSLVGFIQSGTGAVATTVQTKLREWVSVKDFGAKGDGTTDDTAAIQAAVTSLTSSGGTLLFPAGNYKTTAPINWLPRVNLLGVGGHVGSRIVGAHSGNLFQYVNIDFVIVEKLAFDGSGCTAFKQTGAGGNYTQNLTVRDCHFYSQLTECIYGNLIFAKIVDNTFGYYGTVSAAHRHIVSIGSATNITNANVISGNRFYNAKGNESIRFDSGTSLEIISNNFEANTALPVRLNGVFNAKINDNWFEANSIATSEIEINAGTHVIDSTPTEIKRNNFVPAASITNIVQINNSLTKVYFDENTGDLTGKTITNNASKIYSQIGNSFTGLIPPGFLTQETGTFTLTDGSGASLSISGGSGTYTRNGNLITFVVSFTYPVTANGSNAKLTGLPYAASALTPLVSADNSGAAVTFITDAAAITMVPYLVGALTPRTNANLSGKQFYMSGSYLI